MTVLTAVPRSRRKSSASCSAAACVEVAINRRTVELFDSKQNELADQPWIELSLEAWLGVIDEFEGRAPANSNGELHREHAADGSAVFVGLASGTRLQFTPAEMAAFEVGLAAAEFTPELASA